MKIIEKHQGCPELGKSSSNLELPNCWGPAGDYYTVFGTELRFLTKHILISILLGCIFFAIFFFLKRKRKIKVPFFFFLLLSVIATILCFFLLAYFFPVVVYYLE